MVATLNQPQYAPWPVEEQVVALWVALNGYLDEIPVAQVSRFHDELRTSLRAEQKALGAIRDSGDLSDDTVAALRKAVEEFAQGFEIREETGLVGSAS
jgi:F-type H+/Na+-transporting ATPase subunit alpha